MVRALPPELSSQALAEMPEEAHAEETLAALGPGAGGGDRRGAGGRRRGRHPGRARRRRRRSASSPTVEDRAEVDRLLRYDEETAGGRMTTHTGHRARHGDRGARRWTRSGGRRRRSRTSTRCSWWTATGGWSASLPFKDLVISRPERPVRDFMEPADISVAPELDQEEVARLMARYNLPSVAGGGRRRPAARPGHLRRRDRRRRGGDHRGPAPVRRRLGRRGAGAPAGATRCGAGCPGSTVNLLTAFLAGGVVYLFQEHGPAHRGARGRGCRSSPAWAATRAPRRSPSRCAASPWASSRATCSSGWSGKEVLVGMVNGLAIGDRRGRRRRRCWATGPAPRAWWCSWP